MCKRMDMLNHDTLWEGQCKDPLLMRLVKMCKRMDMLNHDTLWEGQCKDLLMRLEGMDMMSHDTLWEGQCKDLLMRLVKRCIYMDMMSHTLWQDQSKDLLMRLVKRCICVDMMSHDILWGGQYQDLLMRLVKRCICMDMGGQCKDLLPMRLAKMCNRMDMMSHDTLWEGQCKDPLMRLVKKVIFVDMMSHTLWQDQCKDLLMRLVKMCKRMDMLNHTLWEDQCKDLLMRLAKMCNGMDMMSHDTLWEGQCKDLLMRLVKRCIYMDMMILDLWEASRGQFHACLKSGCTARIWICSLSMSNTSAAWSLPTLIRSHITWTNLTLEEWEVLRCQIVALHLLARCLDLCLLVEIQGKRIQISEGQRPFAIGWADSRLSPLYFMSQMEQRVFWRLYITDDCTCLTCNDVHAAGGGKWRCALCQTLSTWILECFTQTCSFTVNLFRWFKFKLFRSLDVSTSINQLLSTALNSYFDLASQVLQQCTVHLTDDMDVAGAKHFSC